MGVYGYHYALPYSGPIVCFCIFHPEGWSWVRRRAWRWSTHSPPSRLLDFSRHICSHFDGSTAGVTDAELTKAVNEIIAVEILIYNGFPYVLRLKTKTKTKSETETETKTKTKTKTRELNTNALKKLLPSYLCVTLHIRGRCPIFMGWRWRPWRPSCVLSWAATFPFQVRRDHTRTHTLSLSPFSIMCMFIFVFLSAFVESRKSVIKDLIGKALEQWTKALSFPRGSLQLVPSSPPPLPLSDKDEGLIVPVPAQVQLTVSRCSGVSVSGVLVVSLCSWW